MGPSCHRSEKPLIRGAHAAFARFQPPRHATRAMEVKEKTNKCVATRHCLVYCARVRTVRHSPLCNPPPPQLPAPTVEKWNQLISRQEMQARPALDLCPSDWKKFLSLLRWPADIITAVCHFTLTSLCVTFQIAFPMKQQNSCCRDRGKRKTQNVCSPEINIQ